MRKHKFNQIILWGLLIISLFLLIRLSPALTSPENIPVDDFVRFWAGARLNLAGENPYDPSNINKLQVEVGGQMAESDVISIMLNPPWAISFIMPLGLLSYSISRLVWLLLSIAVILACAQILWRMFNGIQKYHWESWLTVFLFAPTISVLEKGQVTPLVLLGIVGFLYFLHIHSNDWAAGFFLALASIKPQILLIFWIALLFWIVQHRRWIIILSTVATITSFTLLAFIFNFHVVQQYLFAIKTYHISDWATPTIGAYLRYFWLGTDKLWLQFIPSLLGIIWVIYYWYIHHESWEWVNNISIILLVSLVSSPYAWTYDQVVLVPVVIQAFIWLSQDWRRFISISLVILFLGINIINLLLHMRLSEFWFIWMAPVLLIWFLFVKWQQNHMKIIRPSEY